MTCPGVASALDGTVSIIVRQDYSKQGLQE
jgi:hypothetical protein